MAAPYLARAVAPRPTIRGYEITEVLGIGGFAIVVAATRSEDGKQVALKVAHRRDAAAQRRLDAEGGALHAIGSPYVPALLGHGHDTAGRPYLAMERLHGRTLAQILADAPGPLPGTQRDAILDALLSALERLHDVGVVHLDLSPENVFVRDRGGVALIDLGLARRETDPAETGQIAGTAAYMAPEQLRAERTGPATDLYAYGAILFEMLVQRPPFVGSAAEIERGHLLARAPAPGALVADAARFDEVVRQCLQKDPAARPGDVQAIRALLAAPVQPAPTVGEVLPPHTERRLVPLVGVAGPLDRATISARVSAEGAVVARRDGERVVIAFPNLVSDDRLAGPRGLAALLIEDGATCAIVHVAICQVRSDGRRASPRVFGADIEQLAAWWPAEATGLHVTSETVRALGDDAPMPDSAELIGRASLCTRILDDPRTPRLTTVLAAPGTGRTRLARELAHRARSAGRDVLHVQAQRPGLVHGDEALCALIRGAVGTERVTPAVLAALGVPAIWPAVADVLGLERAGARVRTGVPHALAELVGARARRGHLLVVIDDAEWATPELLDGLELAMDDAVGAHVVVLAGTGWARLRPRWGHRAQHHDVVELSPLDGADGRALARAMLAPVERVASDVLDRLVALSGGRPRDLARLVRTLHREGVIRRHPGSDEWFVAADRLDALAPEATAQWFVAREIAALPAGLGALARTCAVLGDDFTVAELEAVQAELARGDPEHVVIDASAGLGELVSRGLVRHHGNARHRFVEPAFQDACYGLADEKLRRWIHNVAYRFWTTTTEASPIECTTHLAYHGARGDRRTEARTCYLALADAARARHADRDAEALYGAALQLTDATDARGQLAILAARGSVRRRLTHYEAAREDLVAARSLAERLGDAVAVADLLVAESAVCDFTQRYGEAAELVARAASALGALPASVEARLRNWLGVSRFHAGRDDEALELLTLAAALGATVGDHETQVGASLLVALLLGRRGRTDEALRLLDEVIALCERMGDDFHRAAAHSNRVEVLRSSGDTDRATADLRAVVEIARASGLALVEAAGYANLAEHLLWCGDVAGAVDAARRGHAQSVRRFRERPLAVVSLYCAQLLAHAGEAVEAGAVLDQVGDADPGDRSVGLMRDAANRAIGRDAPPLAALADEALALGARTQAAEFRWLEGRVALRRADHVTAREALAAARELATAHPGMILAIDRDRALVASAPADAVRSSS